MDKGRAFAGDLLGCRGLYYPVGIGPFGLSCAAWPDTDEKMKRMYGYSDHMIDGGVMFWGQKSNASFGLAVSRRQWSQVQISHDVCPLAI